MQPQPNAMTMIIDDTIPMISRIAERQMISNHDHCLQLFDVLNVEVLLYLVVVCQMCVVGVVVDSSSVT